MPKKTGRLLGNRKNKINWRKELAKYDLNGLSDKRTIDIMLMMEQEEELSAPISVFDEVVKAHLRCSFKSITFKDLLDDVLGDPLTEINPRIQLYNMALAEAKSSIKTVGTIPQELLTKLVKFRIIIALYADVALLDSAENRHLYVILIGFFETKLLKEFRDIGISLSAIVEVLYSPTKTSMESKDDTKSLHHKSETAKLPVVADQIETGRIKPDSCHSRKDYQCFRSFFQVDDKLIDGSVRLTAEHIQLFHYLETMYLIKSFRNSQNIQLPPENLEATLSDLKNVLTPKIIKLLKILAGTTNPQNSVISTILENEFSTPSTSSTSSTNELVHQLLTAMPFSSLFDNNNPSPASLSPCLSNRNINLRFDHDQTDKLLVSTSSADNTSIYKESYMKMQLAMLSSFESNIEVFDSDSSYSTCTDEEESCDANLEENLEETFTNTLDYAEIFWKSFMEMKPAPAYLKNTVHMRIFLDENALFNRSDMSDEEILNSFSDLKTITDMKKRYNDYIKNSKVINVTQRAKKLPISAFKTYNALSDQIPPECFTVELVLNLAVSEVVARVSKKEEAKSSFERQQNALGKKASCVYQKGEENETLGNSRSDASGSVSFDSQKEETKQSIEIEKTTLASGSYEKRKPSSGTVKSGNSQDDDSNFIDVRITPFKLSKPGLKVKKNKSKACAKHLLRTLRMINPNYTPRIVDVDSCIKKLSIKVEDPYYFINNVNEIRHKLSPYPELLKPLSDIHLEMLKKSIPALLMTKFKLNIMDVILGCYQLYFWQQKEQSMPLYHFILKIFKVQFDNMKCKHHTDKHEDTKSKLELMFPKEVCSEVCDFVETDSSIKWMPVTDEADFYKTFIEGVTIPKLFYSPKPSLQESKNVNTYLWYENLNAADFLQCISEAQKKFLCLDHEFSIYGNTLLLRYHNRVNNFGINTKIWNGSLPTKVTLNQFCKFTVHEEHLPKTTYKLGKNRLVQTIGNTHSFHSVDGFNVDVEQLSFVGHPSWITISLCSESNHFVFHWDKKKSFRFHFSFQNNVVLTFQKPTKPVGIKVAELVRRKKDCSKKRPSCTSSLKPIEEENNDTDADEWEDVEESYLKLGDARKIKVASPKHSYKENYFSGEVNRGLKFQKVSFRVCSTALHKFAYFAQRKSYVYLECDEKTLRLLAKHPKYKLQRKLRTLNLYENLSNIKRENRMFFNIRFSLPNKLFVGSVPAYDNFPCNFSQGFLEKGPQCEAIRHEVSRIFLNSGNIIIKRDDGIIKVLSRDGSIEKCEIPGKKISLTKYTRRQCTEFNENSKLEELVKKSQSMGRKKLSHIIAKPRSGHCPFFRKWRKVAKATKLNKKNANNRVEPLDKLEHERFYSKYFQLPVYVYKANKATAYLLSDSGSLVTEFADGTRITSSLAIEESWWYIDLKVDDVWILVNIVYTFEHPNYLTVSYSPYDVQITLPNKINLVVNMEEIIVTYSNTAFNITNKTIKFKKTCLKCNQPSNAVYNIENIYGELVPKQPFLLLYVHDTYGKVFQVDSCGKCFKNSTENDKNEFSKYNCNHHIQQDHQELFVMNRDFSGIKLIDAKGLTKIMEDRFDPTTTKMSLISKNDTSSLSYDAISILSEIEPHYSSFTSQYNFQKQNALDDPNVAAICATYINRMPQFNIDHLVGEIKETSIKKSPKSLEEIFKNYQIPKNEEAKSAWVQSQNESSRSLPSLSASVNYETYEDTKLYKSISRYQKIGKPLLDHSWVELDNIRQKYTESVKKVTKKRMLDDANQDKKNYVMGSNTPVDVTADVYINYLPDTSLTFNEELMLNFDNSISEDSPSYPTEVPPSTINTENLPESEKKSTEQPKKATKQPKKVTKQPKWTTKKTRKLKRKSPKRRHP